MVRMIRKQVRIDVELDRALAARAAATGDSESKIAREALTRHLAETRESVRDAAVRNLEVQWEQDRLAGFTMRGHMPSRAALHQRSKAAFF